MSRGGVELLFAGLSRLLELIAKPQGKIAGRAWMFGRLGLLSLRGPAGPSGPGDEKGEFDGSVKLPRACSYWCDSGHHGHSACRGALAAQDARVLRTPAEREAMRRQVIYLALCDRFHREGVAKEIDKSDLLAFHGGNIPGVARKLGYIRSLGCNVVWLPPLYVQVRDLPGGQFGRVPYHGYWPDYRDGDSQQVSIDPRFGTTHDLKQLISGLHASGMRFCLDLVVNHAGYGARIVDQHPTWFHPDAFDPKDIVRSPLAGLPDFAQERPEAAAWLTNVSLRWIEEFQPDMARLDAAKHVPLRYFRDDWIPAVRRNSPKIFLLAEVMNDEHDHRAVGSIKKYLDIGFDSAFNFWLRDALVLAVARGESLDHVAQVMAQTWRELGEDRALLLTNLLDNHDTRRFASEPDAAVSEAEVERRYFTALILLFSLPGIPQLYYGDELGMYGGPDPDCRRSMPQWAWTANDRERPRGERDAGRPRLCLPEPERSYSWCRRLIALRDSSAALHSGTYVELHRPDGKANWYSFFRGSKDDRVVVVVNESDRAIGVEMPLEDQVALRRGDREAFGKGSVLELLLGQNAAPPTLELRGGQLRVSLPGRSAGIYRWRALD